MSANASLPSWLRDGTGGGGGGDTTPLKYSNTEQSVSTSSSSSSSGETQGSKPLPSWREIFSNKLLMTAWLIRSITLVLCVLMFFTAIVGILSVDGVESVGKIFVGTYMLFFSSVLFIFECIQVYPRESIDYLFRRNFGFMYGTMGRSLFLIFIAFLSFGLGDPVTLTYTTGCLWTIFGIGNLCLYLKYPELFEPPEDDSQTQT